jgi:hypothetical protein
VRLLQLFNCFTGIELSSTCLLAETAFQESLSGVKFGVEALGVFLFATLCTRSFWDYLNKQRAIATKVKATES